MLYLPTACSLPLHVHVYCRTTVDCHDTSSYCKLRSGTVRSRSLLLCVISLRCSVRISSTVSLASATLHLHHSLSVVSPRTENYSIDERKPRTMTPCRTILALVWVASFLRPGDAWINNAPLSSTTLIARSRAASSLSGAVRWRHQNYHPSPATILYAGFGGGSSSSSNTAPQKSKEIKLKPKQQWDRYLGVLKKETAFKVAVKPVDTTEWLEVGAVKSQGSDQTELAVARQRALIAEVRLLVGVAALCLTVSRRVIQ